MIDVEALTDSIDREIRIGVGKNSRTVDRAGIQRNGCVLAATKKVLLADRAGENQFFSG
mgnify:CR=1 FL=1